MLAGVYRFILDCHEKEAVTSPVSCPRRHKANHLPAKLVMAVKAAEVVEADNLLHQVGDLQRRALAILDKAEETGELRTALSAIREVRGNLELLAKLLGELEERPW